MDSDFGVYRVTTPKVDQVLARQRFEMVELPVKSLVLCGRFLVVLYADESYVVFWAERSCESEPNTDSVSVLPTPAPLYLLVETGLLSHEAGYEQIKAEAKQIEEMTEKHERELFSRLLAKYGVGTPAPAPAPVEIDIYSDISKWAGDIHCLTMTEKIILVALANANGKAVAYDTLVSLIGADADDHERNINTLHAHKCRLAKKLKPTWKIGIARGVGYSLIEV